MAEACGGLAGAVEILDVVINRLENAAARVDAAKELEADARRILDISKQVQELAEKHARLSVDEVLTQRIRESLESVEEATREYDDNSFPTKALHRANRSEEIEQNLNIALNFVNLAVNSETKEKTINTLPKQVSGRVDAAQEIQKLNKTAGFWG
jgi:Cdc6-like AAA superfamily ATPase